MIDKHKVWIRGVEGRGSEVRKMLVDLGATTQLEPKDFELSNYIYYISHRGDISYVTVEGEVSQIIMDNYRELKLPEQWKDGDILINSDGTDYKVFWEYDSDTAFYAYVWHGEKLLCFRKYYRLATPSEAEHFHELLHKRGMDWDAEKKQLVDWRWKPKCKETYYYISSVGKTLKTTYLGTDVDRESCKIGNCFRTYQQAEAMAEKVRKLLLGGKK